MLDEAWRALDGPPEATARIAFTGIGTLPSAFAVTDLAAASTAAAALAIDQLRRTDPATSAGPLDPIRVDRRLASLWFGTSIRAQGWAPPPVWDPVAGDYRCQDGWIRLHTNAPAHRRAALQVLGTPADRSVVADAVAGWSGEALEAAIVNAGGCAARMRSQAEWAAHPQGQAIRDEPLMAWREIGPARLDAPVARPIDPARPLAGIRVLDLTRVLAGPVAARFLAGFGATVLRIDPPDWDEPAVLPDTTLGKACARLDVRTAEGREQLQRLMASADIILHGYRPGALDGLGFGPSVREALAPQAVDVSLDAYGWTGPWQGRRGFDSLVQMSSGIADTGRDLRPARPPAPADAPVPLPVQALDHATGHLLAAAAVMALLQRRRDGQVTAARCSLARTAAWLVRQPLSDDAATVARAAQDDDFGPEVEATGWGPTLRLRPPVRIVHCPMRWSRPAGPLGRDLPQWPDMSIA